jgi:uncharacterized phage protein (TIGR02218 family)
VSRVYFDRPLETAATWWRVHRRDGVTLGFTTHDRDLWFGGVLHRAAPGMLPSAIRRTVGFEDDPGDVQGALSHASVREEDLASGRFDDARIESGILDWETCEGDRLYEGSIARVSREAGGFRAELASRKADLAHDPVPLTSPSCRAQFCGPGCALNPAAHEVRALALGLDADTARVTLDIADAEPYRYGSLRWLDGPSTGMTVRIADVQGPAVILAERVDLSLEPPLRVRLREGCDRTLATCAGRFGNAENFRGEPFLPGNDMLAQYPVAR